MRIRASTVPRLEQEALMAGVRRAIPRTDAVLGEPRIVAAIGPVEIAELARPPVPVVARVRRVLE